MRTVAGFHGSFLFRPISAKIENSTSNILDFIFIFQIWNQMICEKKKTKKKKKAQIQVERTKNLFLIAGSLYVVGHLNIPSSLFHPHLHISLLFFSSCWLISLLLFLFFQLPFVLTFRVCLVEWILGKMEKKGGETFWRVFDWEGGRENVW